MKKFNILMLAALALAVSSCGNNKNEADEKADAKDIIGTWYFGINPESFGEVRDYATTTFVFNSDGTMKEENSWSKYEGRYKFEKGVITIWHDKAWTSDDGKNWNPMKENEFDILPNEMTPKFLYNKNIMAFRYSNPEMHLEVESADLMFKKGTNEPSDTKLIQGFWVYWAGMPEDKQVRIAIRFSGNTYDIFIPVWHERESGTYEYKNGMVRLHATKWYSRYSEDYSLNVLEENWKEQDKPNDTYTTDFNSYIDDFAFVVDGDEAYGQIVGLPAAYFKQK